MTAVGRELGVIDQFGDKLRRVEHAARKLYGAGHGVVVHELAAFIRYRIVNALDAGAPLGILVGGVVEV